MRVLVCGGRDFLDWTHLLTVLDDTHRTGPISQLITGGASGADSLANSWALQNDAPISIYRADWKKHGKAAGPIRNQRMIDEGKPDLVIAFPGGRGTADMVNRAKNAGIPIKEIAP